LSGLSIAYTPQVFSVSFDAEPVHMVFRNVRVRSTIMDSSRVDVKNVGPLADETLPTLASRAMLCDTPAAATLRVSEDLGIPRLSEGRTGSRIYLLALLITEASAARLQLRVIP